MRLKLVSAACSLLVLSSAGLAVGGQRFTYPVGIDLRSRYAYGAVGTARNSADPQQNIGCALYGYGDVAASVLGVCTAIDAGGVVASCSFSNKPGLAAAIQAMPSDAFLQFSWDANGQCIFIAARNGSEYEPKR